LSFDRPSFFLGENVLLHFCVENTSGLPFQIDVGGDYQAASRSIRFKATVTDDRGNVVADPDPSGFTFGGMGTTPTVAPHDHWCQSIPLMRYARIERAGTYTVRVSHDLGWPKDTAPVGQTEIRFTMPSADEARDIVATTQALPTAGAPNYSHDEPWKPYQDFSTLRFQIYLTPLLRIVDSGDLKAMPGIGAIPTPEATRALIDLMSRSDQALAREAARTIASRLPDPALTGALPNRGAFVNNQEDPRRYLRDGSWRPEFAPDVRAAARKFLASADTADLIQGAFMLEATGERDDVPSLSAALTLALERTRTLPFERGIYPRPRGAMQELLRAAQVMVARGYVPPAQPERLGDMALWLVAFGQGARPEGWADRLALLLAHDLPYIRELALKNLPLDAPAPLFSAVGAALGSSDVDLQMAGCEMVRQAKLVEHRAAVAAVARTAGPDAGLLMNSASNALAAVGGRVELLEIMASRLTEPRVGQMALGTLFGVFEGTSGWGGSLDDAADLQAVQVHWRTFIAAHQSELEAGKRFALDDPAVSPDLVPKGMKLHRTGKPDWPPRLARALSNDGREHNRGQVRRGDHPRFPLRKPAPADKHFGDDLVGRPVDDRERESAAGISDHAH
jgi:hypothetical protein